MKGYFAGGETFSKTAKKISALKDCSRGFKFDKIDVTFSIETPDDIRDAIEILKTSVYNLDKPLEKEKSEFVLLYDRAVLPDGARISEIIEKFNKHGVVDFNSSHTGNYGQKDVDLKNAVRVLKRKDLSDITDQFILNDLAEKA